VTISVGNISTTAAAEVSRTHIASCWEERLRRIEEIVQQVKKLPVLDDRTADEIYRLQRARAFRRMIIDTSAVIVICSMSRSARHSAGSS